MIKKDFHVHLHGCLTADDLWQIGKDSYKNKFEMLNWYAREFEKYWGRTPEFEQYWNTDSGFELLAKDYIFQESNNFSRFQANFNLIIALCPITTDNFSIQEKIIRNVHAQGLEYFEARTLIPLKFSASQSKTYLEGLCQKVKYLNAELDMETRLVFSLFRDNALAAKQYAQLRAFIKAYPELGSVISGIDFAFSEEGAPPKEKNELFRKFRQDNLYQQPLDLLYHVGESFEDKGIDSAIRWIWQVNELGATRLGHALALGVDPENYRGKTIFEASEERLDTINWLLENSSLLKEYGYIFDISSLEKEKKLFETSSAFITEINYNDSYIENCRSLQAAVSAILKEQKIVIETCPTSNLRIGQITNPLFHPLRFFHEKCLQYVVCADDPGVFDINWSTEDIFAEKIIK